LLRTDRCTAAAGARPLIVGAEPRLWRRIARRAPDGRERAIGLKANSARMNASDPHNRVPAVFENTADDG